MSLKVWLSLDGNLENKGTMPISITNVGATVNTSGKIGNCYNFAGSGQRIKMTNPISDGMNSFSICTWFYMTTASKALFGARTGGSGAGLLCFLYADRILFDDGARFTCYYNVNNLLNSWHHIACIKTPTQKNIYIDGVSIGSQNTTAVTATIKNEITIGNDSYEKYTGNDLLGKLNDFRIYNNALSPSEVKEIAKGLVCHYKLEGPFGGVNENLLRSTPKVYTPANYNSYQLNLSENLVAGQTYTFQFWDVNVSHTGKTAANLGMAVYWGSGNVNLSAMNGTSYFTDGHADYLKFTITISSSQASGSGATNAWLNIYNSVPNASGTLNMNIGKWKVEKGNIATPWCENHLDSGVDTTVVVDSSGYGRHGKITGTLSQDTLSARHTNGLYSSTGVSNYITTPSLSFESHSVTMNIWFKSTNTAPTGDYHMIVDSVANRQWYEMCVNKTGFFRGGLFVNGARQADNGTSTTCLNGNWHMLTLTYDGAKVNRYVDGVMEKATSAAYSSGLSSPTALVIYRDGPSASYACKEVYLSDFRIYATALSDNDVKELYQVNSSVLKQDNMNSYEFSETGAISVNDTGVVTSKGISEINALAALKYDTNVYIEPDGSAWVRVFHHNNPGAGSFASSDTFTSSVYKDANRWFNVEVANYLDKWEIMVKGKFTATSDEWKLRWIQQYNPMTATYANVAAANVTKITTAGYSSSPSSWGGLYKNGSQTYLCANNGTSGNWWGAVGSYSVYQNGIPGWGPSLTVTTTGYNDIYLRIDNISDTTTQHVRFEKSGMITASNFIEK